MTAAEIVACVDEMRRQASAVRVNMAMGLSVDALCGNARNAFHEAGKLLDLCEPKTCGTCAHVLVRPGHGDFGDWLRCGCEYAPAYLADVTYTECCRSWRRKEVPSDCA